MRGIDLPLPADMDARLREKEASRVQKEPSKGSSKGPPKESSKEPPKESPKGPSKGPPKESSKDSSKEPPKESPKEPPRESPSPAAVEKGAAAVERPDAALERSAEAEAGEGELVCNYGVEVVELLEMEPLDDARRRPRRKVAWNKYASVVFMLAFLLGLLNAAASLFYSSGAGSPADLLAGASCEVAGEVKDSLGNPVPNATVVVTDGGRVALTNSDGWYVLKGLRPGRHSMEASAEGYGSMSIRTDIQPNLLNSLDFTLEKGGAAVRVEEPAASDFGEAGNSYFWSVPLLLVFSACALGAALVCLRRPVPQWPALVLGALGILSFGFGAGSLLALAGTVMAALARPESGPLPLKKLRVGLPYPSRRPIIKREARPATAKKGMEPLVYGETERTHTAEKGFSALEAPRTVAPPESGQPAPPPVPLPEGPEPEPKKAPVPEGMSHEAEVDAAPMVKPRPQRPKAADGPKRYIRRSTKGRLRCFACVEEIALGSEYIRCSCGKVVHIRCLKEPRCPSCKDRFGRSVAR